MKHLHLAVAVLCLATPGFAQEHYTEGAVWECGMYRTKQGHFDDYMTYLRQTVVPQTAASKKAGLILDQKVYIHVPANPTDPDVVICTLHPSFAKALDYDASDDAKGKEIATAFYKTADEQKQRDMAARRYEFRDFLGTEYYREVVLKPMP